MAGPPCLAGSLHYVYMGLIDLYMSKKVGNLQGSKMDILFPISGSDVSPMFTLS